MDTTITYTPSTGSLWLPYAGMEKFLSGLDAALQALSYRNAGIPAGRFQPDFYYEIDGQGGAEKPESSFTAIGIEQPERGQAPVTSVTKLSTTYVLQAMNENTFRTVVPLSVAPVPPGAAMAAIRHETLSPVPMYSEQVSVTSVAKLTTAYVLQAVDRELSRNVDLSVGLLPAHDLRETRQETSCLTAPSPFSDSAVDYTLLERQQASFSEHNTSTAKNYTISFEHLIGTVNNSFEAGQSPQDNSNFMQQLTDALQTMLNDTTNLL